MTIRIKNYRLIWTIGISIIIYILLQNALLTVRLRLLEERVAGLEAKTGEVDMVFCQASKIKAYIIKTNPRVAESRAADIAYAIVASARMNELDPMLLTGVAKAESTFQMDTVSAADARGLLQVRPATFRTVHSGDPSDWRAGVEAGARYLHYLIRRFGDLRLALAAYNCGPSHSRERILKTSGSYADAILKDRISLNNNP
jgi:soluble lytic murein transglycosylase-like protein